MTLLGQFSLWVALLIGSWCVVLSLSGRWRDRPDLERVITRSVYAVCAALLIATLSLWKGLISHDFNIEYVAAYTSRNLPTYYIVSALWAGQKGSLLFWAVVLSLSRPPRSS
jgi:cytochrome c-type biogenesis protein CcmF